ncbi:MAG: hypothetical protein WCY05_06490, partial [Candidatus Omnitrophota bacterium]
MTAITSFPNHFFGQMETLGIPNPQLSVGIDIDDLEINLNTPIYYPGTTTVVLLPFTIVIRNATTNFPETIHVLANQLDVTGTKITLTNLNQRGINTSVTSTGDVDYLSGDITRRSEHPQRSEVRISIHPLDFASMAKALRGEIASGSQFWQIGRDVDENIITYAANGDVNMPWWGYIAASDGWYFSNNGVDSTPFGTGAGVTGGDGITVTLGDIDIDLADSTIFKNARTGNEIRVPLTAIADGKLSKTFMPAYLENLMDSGTSVEEIDQALDGISANVTATNLNIVTGGVASNADAFHTHGVGVVNLANREVNKGTGGETGTFNIDFAVGSANTKRVKFNYAIVVGYGSESGHSWVRESGILECDFTNVSCQLTGDTNTGAGAGTGTYLNFWTSSSFPSGQESTLPSVTGPATSNLVITSI